MSRRITAGNDAPFRWAVKLQGKPFDLSGKDVKVYVINSRGEIPVAQLTIEGHEVSGVFEGRYQTRLGEHSLVLRVNEGRPEMKTAAVANVFELVQWSADAGGSDEGDVIVAPILIESELSIGGGSSYDDTEVKNELARLEREKADKSELTDYLPREEFEERIEGYATHDSVQELSENVTELSAEVGKKQDTLVSGTNIKTINGQSIVGSGNIEIQGGGGGASSDKQGVVSQTLTWNTTDEVYEISNIKRGAIPQMFIDLVTEAGASYDEASGYFSLNGIDNIAYDEMRKIYDARTCYGINSVLAIYGESYEARTNFAVFRGYKASYANHEPTTAYCKYIAQMNSTITKFAFCQDVSLFIRANSGNNFDEYGVGAGKTKWSRIEEILGVIDVANLTGSANFFYNGAYLPRLTSFNLKQLKASIDLSGMPRLSEATILYMINNEKATAAITIKLHADAKATADASEAIQAALTSHPNVTLAK